MTTLLQQKLAPPDESVRPEESDKNLPLATNAVQVKSTADLSVGSPLDAGAGNVPKVSALSPPVMRSEGQGSHAPQKLKSALVSDLLAMRRQQGKPRKFDQYTRGKTVSELLKERKQMSRNKADASSNGESRTSMSTKGSNQKQTSTRVQPPEGCERTRTPGNGSEETRRANLPGTRDNITLVLPRDREEVLANHIAELSSYGYRYYIIQILQMATQMSEYYGLKLKDGALINESWYRTFLNRCPKAKTVNNTNKLVPSEALKCINWDLVDLAATQDALALTGDHGAPGRGDQSEGKMKSASALMTEMILSYCKQFTE